MSNVAIRVATLAKLYQIGRNGAGKSTLLKILSRVTAPTSGAGTVDVNHLLYSFCFMLAVVFLGSIIFNRVEQKFMDTV